MKPSFIPGEITILKIGGRVLDDETALSRVLDRFARIEGAKILVHGGGRAATELAGRLDLPQTLIEGRRVTDEPTLRIAVMVYAGLINKSLVAGLQARGCQALGICGADLDLIRARRRPPEPVDFGFVGDVAAVRTESILPWLSKSVIPVIAPLSHDGEGALLNTNADTIARALACALASAPSAPAIRLIFSFEKSGVLRDPHDPASHLRTLSFPEYRKLRETGAVSAGMIPKLENAFSALEAGVSEVILGKADELDRLLRGEAGTRCQKEPAHES